MIDAFSQVQYGSNTCQDTLNTTKSNDLIVVFTGAESSGLVFTVTDTANLPWHLRASTQFNASGQFVDTFEEYYTTAPQPLANDTITVTYILTGGRIGCSALGIAGANATSPFDPSNPSLGCAHDGVPQVSSSTNATDSATLPICTSNTNDLIISGLWMRGDGLNSSPANFTALAGGGQLSFNEAYQRVFTNETNLAVTWTFGGDSWAMINDAVTADS